MLVFCLLATHKIGQCSEQSNGNHCLEVNEQSATGVAMRLCRQGTIEMLTAAALALVLVHTDSGGTTRREFTEANVAQQLVRQSMMMTRS